MGALANDLGHRPRRRTRRYVEEPRAEIVRQDAQIRDRSRDLVRYAGWLTWQRREPAARIRRRSAPGDDSRPT